MQLYHTTHCQSCHISFFWWACSWQDECLPELTTTNCVFSYDYKLLIMFQEFGCTWNKPQNCDPRVAKPSQDLRIRPIHLQDCLRPFIQKIKDFLHKLSGTTRGLDMTALHCHNPLECEMVCTLIRHVIYWTCSLYSGSMCTAMCFKSCQFPTTLHSHWSHWNKWTVVQFIIFLDKNANFNVVFYFEQLSSSQHNTAV